MESVNDISYSTDGYVIEAIYHYFGMEDINCSPTRHALPAEEKRNITPWHNWKNSAGQR